MRWKSWNERTGMGMNRRNRTFFVWVSLVASMTIAGLLLMALDQKTPMTGAYSLASYLRLDPIEKAAFRPITARPAEWNRIEVYYSRTNSGNAGDVAMISSLRGTARADFHFLVGNGKGAGDGQIQCTDSWVQQKTTNGIIRICVVADLYDSPVTAYQLRRTAALVEALSRRFNIKTQYIHYPANWQF
ncbi:MAG TPA: hypothetical protein PKY88_07340 [Anaerohalosphaeraceae bacterium]|nr:hypothetical protein [Anaerohalosphaeraceae bacterium]